VAADAVTRQGGQVVGHGSRVGDAPVLVNAHRPDVAILAVGLPDGDGIEAARRVAEAFPCPVVLITSHTDAEITARAARAGVLAFLAKPLRQEELGPALDLAVSRFRDLQNARRENEVLKRKLESRKLVERAKGLLIRRFGLSEPEAYRHLQKTSMDTRRPIGEVARTLLVTEEPESLRSAE
jgi:response regulator NasT